MAPTDGGPNDEIIVIPDSHSMDIDQVGVKTDGLVVEDLLGQVLKHVRNLEALISDNEGDSFVQVDKDGTGDVEMEVAPAILEDEKIAHMSEVKRLWAILQELTDETNIIMSDDHIVVDAFKSMDEVVGVEASSLDLETIQTLKCSIARALEKLRPVDIDKLCELLAASDSAGQAMADKDVLLMLGDTGAGKTTTILFLAGASFNEEEVEGEFHLKAISFPDPQLASFRSCGGSSSVTKTVQCVETMVDGEAVVLCDVPGFGDTAGTEIDIANGMGIVQAIQRAKAVKPVLVLSKNGMGDRFRGVSETLDTITRLLGDNPNADCLEAFSYLFTKYDARYKDIIYKQFHATVERKRSEKGSLLLALMADIAAKTNPEAQIVLPLDGNPQKLLKLLWTGNGEKSLDPKTAFSEFVSEAASNKLQLQLQYTKSNFEDALRKKHMCIAQRYLKQLERLGRLLPVAREAYDRCFEMAVQLLVASREKACVSVRRFQNTVAHDATFAEDLQSLKMELDSVAVLEPFRAECTPQEPNITDFCSVILTKLVAAVGKSLFQFNSSTAVEFVLDSVKQYTTELRRLEEVHEVFPDSGETRDGYSSGIERFMSIAEATVVEAEVCLTALPEGMVGFCRVSHSMESLCAQFCSVSTSENGAKSAEAIKYRWGLLLENLEKLVHSAMDGISAMVSSLGDGAKEVAEGKEPSCLPDMSLPVLKEWRDLLVALSQASSASEFPILSMEGMQGAVVSLDSCLKASFRQLLDHSTKTLTNIKSAEGETGDVFSAHLKLESQHELLSYMDIHFSELRSWPVDVSSTVLPFLDHLCAFQHALYEYKAKLEVKIEDLRKQRADVTSQARIFFRRLQSETEDCASLLKELGHEECWSTWEEAAKKHRSESNEKKKKKKKGWFRAVGEFIGFNNETSSLDNDEDDLGRLLDEILELFQCRMDAAARAIRGVQWNNLSFRQVVNMCFEQAPHYILLWVEFLGLQQRNPCLAELILSGCKGSSLHTQAIAAEVSLTLALQSLGHHCCEALKAKQFAELERLLQALQRESALIESLRAFSSVEQIHLIGPDMDFAMERRCSFIQSIHACADYQGLRMNVIGEALQIERSMNALSFMDETSIRSANEYDRSRFYRGILANLDAASSAACLTKHTSDDATCLKLQSLRDDAIKVVTDETQKIGDEVNTRLSRFPDFVSDFPLLNIWLGNLGTLSNVFSNEVPTVAARSNSLREEAERTLLERLNGVVHSPPAETRDLIQKLICLKRASIMISKWRGEINRCIDTLLSQASQRSPNGGRFALDLSVQLNAAEDEDSAIAKQILHDHEIFGGAMNAVFNSATARQGIGYVIRGLDLVPDHAVQLKRMYEHFLREYKDIVGDGLLSGLENQPGLNGFFGNLADEAALIATDLAMDYESQLVSLSAHLFAFWSLQSMNCFAQQNDSDLRENDDSMNFLRKPHAAQVVAVWTMLNFKERRFHSVENQMCELKTGEGKSIVLGVTATILSMMGCDVNCVCYSSYLSQRDYSDFLDMFRRFGADNHIKYDTIDDLYSRIVFRENKTARLAENVLLGKQCSPTMDGVHDSTRLKVLLVDEVDVLFKEDFFGKTFNPCLGYDDESVSELFHYIWAHQGALNNSSVLETPPAKRLLQTFPTDVHALVENQIMQMLTGASAVSSGAATKYSVSNDRIAYKHLDGITTTTRYGYQTAFAYIKECEEGNITERSKNSHVTLTPRCGEFSYAELPVGFDAVLGVTGTLSGLSASKKEVLKTTYDIPHFAYLPSVYGVNKLQFAGDCARDVILCDSTDDYFLEIRTDMNRRQQPLHGFNRPVMVFFPGRKLMEGFYNSDHMKDLRDKNSVRMITEEEDPSGKEAAFLRATEAGAVTLLIREYGRGTDFKCFDSKVLNAGGVHVIQAFFSVDIAEEMQLKGRTARQGAEGSYSMVLRTKDLGTDLNITARDVESMRRESKFYTLLDERRSGEEENNLDAINEEVKDAEAMHYRSMAFIMAARNNRRQEAVDFLFECNDVPCCGRKSFAGNDLKQKFRNERDQRLKVHYDRQRERRQTEQESALPDEEEPTVLLLEAEDTSHYGVLGVSRDAPNRVISRAFRRLAKIHHPDKSNNDNAAAIFRRLKEARNVLLGERTRAAYDESIGRNGNQSA